MYEDLDTAERTCRLEEEIVRLEKEIRNLKDRLIGKMILALQEIIAERDA